MPTRNGYIFLLVLLRLPVFAALGALSGWVTGASSSPAATALLALVAGIGGGVAVTLAENRSKSQTDTSASHSTVLNSTTWSIGMLIFCATCYQGLQSGIQFRVPEYPSLQLMAPEAFRESSQLSPIELAALYKIRWQLQGSGIDAFEAKAYFRDVVSPILGLEPNVIDFGLVSTREKTLSQLAEILGDAKAIHTIVDAGSISGDNTGVS